MTRASSVFYISILLYFSTILTYTEQKRNVTMVLHDIGDFIPSLQNVSKKACDGALYPLYNRFNSSVRFESPHFCSNLTSGVKAVCKEVIFSMCLLAPYPVLIPACQYFLPKFLCK